MNRALVIIDSAFSVVGKSFDSLVCLFFLPLIRAFTNSRGMHFWETGIQ